MRNETQLNSDSDVQKFVEEYIDSFVCWDILLFFYHNPGTQESCESLSKRIGRSENDVYSCLVGLVKKNVVMTITDGVYRANSDPKYLCRLKAFNDALAVAPTRFAILNQVLTKRRIRYVRDDS